MLFVGGVPGDGPIVAGQVGGAYIFLCNAVVTALLVKDGLMKNCFAVYIENFFGGGIIYIFIMTSGLASVRYHRALQARP